MEDFAEEREEFVPEVNFQEIITFQRRSSLEVERQVTVSRYRTHSTFDFDQVKRAVERCRIRAGNDFGIIDYHTSESDSVAQNSPSDRDGSENDTVESGHSELWVRALFAIIGEKNFRWLDFETRDILEYLIPGALDATFQIEYFKNPDNELRFLTYGGSRFAERINRKHRSCFGMHFMGVMEEFTYDFVKRTCSRPEFVGNLKSIVYDPEGEAGYGTVEVASMRTKYKNVIDPSAKLVREILSNPKILISEFESRCSILSPEVSDRINIRFQLSKNGRVTLYLPEIRFPMPLLDIDRENAIYDIVREAYAYITRKAVSRGQGTTKLYADSGQLIMEFIKDV